MPSAARFSSLWTAGRVSGFGPNTLMCPIPCNTHTDMGIFFVFSPFPLLTALRQSLALRHPPLSLQPVVPDRLLGGPGTAALSVGLFHTRIVHSLVGAACVFHHLQRRRRCPFR